MVIISLKKLLARDQNQNVSVRSVVQE